MKNIPLSQGKIAIIDDADLAMIGQYRWFAHSVKRKHVPDVWYAKGHIEGRKMFYMHRLILGLTDRTIYVDHINRNGLDNRRANLRIATNSQNQGNLVSTRGTSRYKGVCWDKNIRKWRAYIGKGKDRKHLGVFGSEEVAAMAYDAAALERWGGFARLNF